MSVGFGTLVLGDVCFAKNDPLVMTSQYRLCTLRYLGHACVSDINQIDLPLFALVNLAL